MDEPIRLVGQATSPFGKTRERFAEWRNAQPIINRGQSREIEIRTLRDEVVRLHMRIAAYVIIRCAGSVVNGRARAMGRARRFMY